MNEDSKIIMSDAPHEVHIPEGSKTAVHKTAQAQAPVVRNTDVDVGAPVEQVTIAPTVRAGEAPVALKDRFVTAPETQRPEHQSALPEVANLPDQFVSDTAPQGVPAGVPQPTVADTQPSPASAVVPVVPEDPHATATATATATTTEAETETEHATFMGEMDFPARVVKLKIDNDKVRSQIDNLEKPLFPPVVETAPAAKGKGKEQAAKKPAKGH
jgi:hypothetical protein